MKKSNPKPSTPPGINKDGRTYQEQLDYENSRKGRSSKPTKSLFEKMTTKSPLNNLTNATAKVSSSAPNMGVSKKKDRDALMKKQALAAKLAPKVIKKGSKIPPSPTN